MATKTLSNALNCNNGQIVIDSNVVKSAIGYNQRIANGEIVLKFNDNQSHTFDVSVKYSSDTDTTLIDRVENNTNASIRINITEELNCLANSSQEQITLILTGASNCSSYANLEIEYFSQKTMSENNAYTEFDVSTAAKGKINLATGNLRLTSNTGLVFNTYSKDSNEISIEDTNAQSNVTKFNTHCGKGWQAPWQQYLVKRKGDDDQSVYTYVDSNGNYHEFTEKYYYKQDGTKVYVDKNTVNVSVDGKLTYNDKEVFVEKKTTSGYSLETDVTQFVGGQFVETRQQEQIELEEQCTAYKSQLNEYVVVNTSNGETVRTFPQHCADGITEQTLNSFLPQSDQLLLTRSEAVQYNSLLLQQTTDSSNNKSSDENSSIENKGVVEKRSKINFYQNILYHLTKKTNYKQTPEDDTNYQYDRYRDYVYYRGLRHSKSCLLSSLRNKADDISSVDNTQTDYMKLFVTHLQDECCDLEAELDAVENSIAQKNIEQYKYSDPVLYELEKTKLKISNHIKTFQNSFQNSIAENQESLNSYENELNNILFAEQGILVNQQLQMLIDQSNINVENIKKYCKQLLSCQYQLDTINTQMPTIYVTSGTDVMGFNKDGRLVLLFDSYDNQTSVVYQDDKITSITDTDNKETKLQYDNQGLLCKVTDTDEKATLFSYDGSKLSTITLSDGKKTLYQYTESGLLQSVTDCTGYGIRLEYDQYNRVTGVYQFTDTMDISENGKCSLATRQEKKLYTINYHESHKSTSVTDSKGVTTSYIFDILGRPVTVYEGVYSDPEQTTRSVSIEYFDGKQSYEISEDVSSQNILLNVSPYIDTLSNHNATSRQKIYRFENLETFQNTTDIVFSAWAKADSAFIYDGQTSPHIDADNAVQGTDTRTNRRFGLWAKVIYDDESYLTYAVSYDWLNTDWQYVALPIELDKQQLSGAILPSQFPIKLADTARVIKKVEFGIDYSNNIGDIQVDCISLRKGTWTYSQFDTQGRKISSENSLDNTTTKYVYNDKDQLVSQTLINRNNKAYTTTYEYNKQGKLIRTTDYNGLVQETVYDQSGNTVKTITYNIDNPTAKLYNESIIDDKGNVAAEVDQSGLFNSTEYTYTDNTSTVVNDGNGNATAQGYCDDGLNSISADCDGESNSNTLHYTDGLLTRVSSGNTDYSYDYDGWHRIKQVKIAGNMYAQNTYIDDNTTETLYATGDRVTTVTDKYGLTETTTTIWQNGNTTQVVDNTYNDAGNITLKSIKVDNSDRYRIRYQYDANGNITSEEHERAISETQTAGTTKEQTDGTIKWQNHFTKTNVYSAENRLQSTQYTVDGSNLLYAYQSDNTPEQRQIKVTLPFAEQNIKYDGLGRTKEITLGSFLAKDIHYAQYGDHATNRVSSVWCAVNGIRKDNTRYTYDKANNITSVSDNGKLVARYAYDSLNRLVREDNTIFGTTTYTYDNNCNILQKVVYPYTLADTLTDGTVHQYGYSAYGWQDQLLTYDQQQCQYDSIGNPTLYRGNTATWQGRRLIDYRGITYTYDHNSIRTSKSANGTTIEYFYDGTTLLAEKRTNSTATQWIYYIYGVDGIAGMRVGTQDYLFRKNIQGDVTHIYTKDGQLVAQYRYDAWGNCKVYTADGTLDTNLGSIGNANPFRYRGYYYDSETALYYLNTRYYDPETARFINADDISYLDPETINGLNLYAYCGDNPVIYVDPSGNFPILIALILGAFAIAGMAIGGKMAYDQGKRGWDLFGSIILGGAIGLAAGGLIVATSGAIYGAVYGIGATMFGGLTAGQVFAIGAVTYNLVVVTIAPFVSTNLELIEWGAPSYSPSKPASTPIHPSQSKLSKFSINIPSSLNIIHALRIKLEDILKCLNSKANFQKQVNNT